MANRVFRVKLKPELASQVNDEPKEVIVRFFGSEILKNADMTKMLGDSVELLIFYTASLNNLGPKLIGAFEHGRIDEYIDNERPPKEELKDFEIDKVVARIFARIHSMDMPISKKNIYYRTIFYVWMGGPPVSEELENTEGKNTEEEKIFDYTPEENAMADEIDKFELFKEVEWIENTAKKINAKHVFCHNDLHLFNILFKKDKSLPLAERVVPIDMELSSYNWRGYDLGYYFNFRNYHINEKKIDFSTADIFPDEEFRRKFISIYLDALKEVDPKFDPEIDNVEQVLKEVGLLSLVSHLFSFGFFINHRTRRTAFDDFLKEENIDGPKEEFYLGIDYAYHRFKQYAIEKESFLTKYKSIQ